MKINLMDTIAAISTPPGENGIGIVRLSGPSAVEVVDRSFVSKNGTRLSDYASHTIHYGYIANKDRKIDEVLVSVMRGPKTYTREDIVEINCHGGVVVLKDVLDLIVSKGARLAEPGEFTKRAFLNGRLDLMQAEAVLDIIRSRTTDGLNIAQRQLSGEISQNLKDMRSALVDLLAAIEADINFPDEDIDVARSDSLKTSLAKIERDLEALIASSDKGAILREGITTVICGKPNVGKSTLMNKFLKQKRVIVSPLPRTTRDTIEEIINVRGIPLRIVDTAGVIHADDEITKDSVERSLHYMEVADLILLVLDSSDKLNDQDMHIIDRVRDKKTLVVVNKTDLPEVLQVEEISRHLHDKRVVKISAKENLGIDELEVAIYEMFWSGKISAENISLSNSRHIEAINNAIAFTRGALEGIGTGRAVELLAIDIKDAAEALGVVTGESFTEDLLDSIFSNFCIGK